MGGSRGAAVETFSDLVKNKQILWKQEGLGQKGKIKHYPTVLQDRESDLGLSV